MFQRVWLRDKSAVVVSVLFLNLGQMCKRHYLASTLKETRLVNARVNDCEHFKVVHTVKDLTVITVVARTYRLYMSCFKEINCEH
jgi:hypothetical protein